MSLIPQPSDFSSMPDSLAGRMLLAEPLMQDDQFAHTVVLLTHHARDEGAVGFVMNRALGKKVGDLVQQPEVTGLESIPVYYGGPVEDDHLSFVAFYWDPQKDQLNCSQNLTAPQARGMKEEGWQVRAYVGYSGWAAGQLEKELKLNSWIVKKPNAQILQENERRTHWEEQLVEMGPYFHLLSQMPRNPWLN